MGGFIKIGGSSGNGSGATSYSGLSDKDTVDLPTINTPLVTALNGKENIENKKTDVDANKTSNTFFPTVKAVFDWVTGLFVKGAASSTDNAVVRFDGINGKSVQNSSVVINDSGNMSVGNGTSSAKLTVTGDTGFDIFSAVSVDVNAVGQRTYVDRYGAINCVAKTNTSLNSVYGIVGTTGTFARLMIGLNNGEPFIAAGSGTASRDVYLHRSAVNTWRISSNGSSGAANLHLTGKFIDSQNNDGISDDVLCNVSGLPVWKKPGAGNYACSVWKEGDSINPVTGVVGAYNVVWHNDGQLNTTTGVYTVPITGLYKVEFDAFKHTNNVATEIRLYKNGSQTGVRAFMDSTANNEYESGHISVMGNFNAGDTLDIRVTQGGVHGNESCYLNIYKVR